MLKCHLQLKVKSKTGCPFLMYKLFVKIMFGTVYALAHKCLQICSSWTKLHKELVCLKDIFLKNGYPEDFINKCFNKIYG